MARLGLRPWNRTGSSGRTEPDPPQVGTELKLLCPDCRKTVRVGGPYLGHWTILRHAMGDDPMVSCPGTEKKIPL